MQIYELTYECGTYRKIDSRNNSKLSIRTSHSGTANFNLQYSANEEEYRVVSFNFQKLLYESIEDPIKRKCIKY